jgi:uncharacterized MAPEG superfamily protein
MKISLLMVLVAGLLPVLCAGMAKAGFKGYDNRNPRAWLQGQSGWRARADAAQNNSLEAFPFFAAAVLACLHTGVDAALVDAMAVVFVLLRLAYIACYVTDRAGPRSLVWTVGHGVIVALFVLAVRA